MTAPRLVCAGCGWEPSAHAPYPFRCARSGTDDGDHVLTHRLSADAVLDRGDDENPFVRYRECLYARHAARARGMSDAAFVDLVRRLDDRIAAVDGRGFRVTPFGRAGGRPQAAAGADEPRGGHAAPVRRLNAAIISSHAGRRSCIPRQKAWSRRASKSSSATPRCSTQVK